MTYESTAVPCARVDAKEQRKMSGIFKTKYIIAIAIVCAVALTAGLGFTSRADWVRPESQMTAGIATGEWDGKPTMPDKSKYPNGALTLDVDGKPVDQKLEISEWNGYYEFKVEIMYDYQTMTFFCNGERVAYALKGDLAYFDGTSYTFYKKGRYVFYFMPSDNAAGVYAP